MAQEKIAPASKPVNARDGIKSGGHSTLTTPVENANGRYWGGKEEKNKIMK